jgi:hypothetical protein
VVPSARAGTGCTLETLKPAVPQSLYRPRDRRAAEHEAGGDGRERPWRRVVDDIDFPVSSRGRGDQLRAMLVAAQRDLELFTRFLDGETDPDDWSASVTVYTRTAVMDAGQLAAWGAAVETVTREHADRARRQPPADHRPVRLTIRGFPQVFPTAAAPGG